MSAIADVTGKVRSFHRRRIALPSFIDASSLVLDVGSGDKPHWRADVLVDRFPEAEHAVQRSGTAAARTPRPLFDADVTDMPFVDKVFDYVICSHLLEHVTDPAAAIDEMVRVSKAGYIEVPRATSAKVIDFPSHVWWCRDEGGPGGARTLVFTAKTTHAFDPEIESFARLPHIERELNALIDRYLDDCVIALAWSGDVSYRVEGVVDDDLLARVAVSNAHHKQAETLAGRVLTAALTLPERRRLRRAPVRHDDIVREPFRLGRDEALTPRRYAVQ